MDNRLYNRRKELGLTLEQVGKICSVGKSTVRKWENGIINNMGRDKIVLLAKALDVSPMFILQAESSERVLSKFDNEILDICEKLNDIGKEKAKERIEELTLIQKYKKSSMELKIVGKSGTSIDYIDKESAINALEEDDKNKKAIPSNTF